MKKVEVKFDPFDVDWTTVKKEYIVDVREPDLIFVGGVMAREEANRLLLELSIRSHRPSLLRIDFGIPKSDIYLSNGKYRFHSFNARVRNKVEDALVLFSLLISSHNLQKALKKALLSKEEIASDYSLKTQPIFEDIIEEFKTILEKDAI
jgi:hypothetical protein